MAAQKLNEIDDSLIADEIGSMTVRELISYSKENDIPLENLFKVAAGDIDKSIEGKTMISREEAQRIALERVDGEIIKLELDDSHDDDDPEYDIEILADGVKYEMEIDAYTGEIKEFEADDYDHNHDDRSASSSNQQPQKSSQGRISADQAKSIALELTGGGKITDFDLDDDEYEIEIKIDGKEYDIEIDAYTGKVIDFEVEDDN